MGGVVSVRIFGHYVSRPLVLLMLAEAAIHVGAVYLAGTLRFLDMHFVIYSPGGDYGWLLPRSLLYALVMLGVMTGFGLDGSGRAAPNRRGGGGSEGPVKRPFSYLQASRVQARGDQHCGFADLLRTGNRLCSAEFTERELDGLFRGILQDRFSEVLEACIRYLRKWSDVGRHPADYAGRGVGHLARDRPADPVSAEARR